MKANHTYLLAGACALTVFAISACSSGKSVTQPQITPSIDAANQSVSLSNRVVVAEAVADAPAWVVIRDLSGGMLGAVLGHTGIPKGTSHAIAVDLNRDIVDGETLYAVLHDDDGQVGVFEFPGGDMPVMETGGGMGMVEKSFAVSTEAQAHPSIAASAQSLSNLSTLVTVAQALSVGPGWVTIHEDAAGSPGAVIGHARIVSGSHSNVAVTLERPALDGETLYAMLHVDAGVVGTYEFPGADVPAQNAGVTVMEPFVVTVAAGTPAVRLRLTSIGMSAYDFTAVEPAAYASVLGSASNNQTLTLAAGWRYEIVSSVAGPHPFELTHRGTGPATDQVLLSQSAAGSLESDASIGWQGNGTATIRFTLSPSLGAQLSGYRCSIHKSTMRGNVVIE
jgi:hypothetical protein